MKKSKDRSLFIYVSVLFNIVLIIILFYVVCVKTDIIYRFLARFDLATYSVVDTRHRIEFRCLEGWKNTLEKLNIDVDVVFYGNSITFESNFQNDFTQLKICNLGCNRDDLDDMIHRSFLINSVHPHKIFVLGGINGFVDIPLKEFQKKYRVLIDTIKYQNPHAKLYIQSLLPVNTDMEIGSRYLDCHDKIKKANAILRDISLEKECVFIDLYSAYQIHDSLPQEYTRDGLHLTPHAYTIWNQCISPYLAE